MRTDRNFLPSELAPSSEFLLTGQRTKYRVCGPPDPSYTPSDFQIRLWVNAGPNTLPLEFKPPPLIEASATLGQLHITSTLGLEEAAIRQFPSTRNPNHSIVYSNRSTHVDNLSSLKSVTALVDQKISIRVPSRVFRVGDRQGPRYYLECSIRGERIVVEVDHSGSFEGQLTKEMLNQPARF